MYIKNVLRHLCANYQWNISGPEKNCSRYWFELSSESELVAVSGEMYIKDVVRHLCAKYQWNISGPKTFSHVINLNWVLNLNWWLSVELYRDSKIIAHVINLNWVLNLNWWQPVELYREPKTISHVINLNWVQILNRWPIASFLVFGFRYFLLIICTSPSREFREKFITGSHQFRFRFVFHGNLGLFL